MTDPITISLIGGGIAGFIFGFIAGVCVEKDPRTRERGYPPMCNPPPPKTRPQMPPMPAPPMPATLKPRGDRR